MFIYIDQSALIISIIIIIWNDYDTIKTLYSEYFDRDWP